jgi:hypothetical protein
MPSPSGHKGEPESTHRDGHHEAAADATVTPSAALPQLDESALAGLRAVGRSWTGCMPPHEVWEGALPVDRNLEFVGPEPAGGRFIQIRARHSGSDDELEATSEADKGRSRRERIAYTFRHVIIGPALRSTAIAEERMGRLLALAVLSPDALSSVAYGPAAMMGVLLLAGSSNLKLSLPIGAAIAVLMLSVGLGYRQVIRAYPHGGGS